MGDHQYALAAADGRRQDFVPVGQDALDAILEAFGARHLIQRQTGIARVGGQGLLLLDTLLGRRHVVAATPDQHLVFTVLSRGLGLVQAGQAAVVTLVEAPVAHYRQPHLVHAFLHVPEGAHGALEYRHMGHVEEEAGVLECLAALVGLADPLLGQIHIRPATEAVFQVPRRLAMADEYDLRHATSILGFIVWLTPTRSCAKHTADGGDRHGHHGNRDASGTREEP